MFETKYGRAACFYDKFERKNGDPEVTTYCPGCGHGVLHKMIAEAIDDFGIADRTILLSPVGCAVFMYYYLDVGNIQVSHGRSPAVATGVKRVRPGSVVISYQGDGDLAAIGGNEILHAANRGENITVFFVNNGIYGMTGGQMAPTTPLGQKTTTSPRGRSFAVEGPPMRVCELLATLDGPAYIERVALTDAKNHMATRKAVRKALQNQIDGKGFSLVEVLSACPSGWKASPPDAIRWVEQNMVPVFPPGVFRDIDRSGDIRPSPAPAQPAPATEAAGGEAASAPAAPAGEFKEIALTLSGFGGQGVLFAGVSLAEGAVHEGLETTWIPSYGPEMRGGTAHCHLRLSREAIASPLITRPGHVIAFNQPSVEKFAPAIVPGGLLVVNSSLVKGLPDRQDIRVVQVPAYEIAEGLGNPKAANMVLVGAYIEVTKAVGAKSIHDALVEKGVKAKLVEANMQAIEAGRRAVRK
ncbi:MAG: 2-oxoacid:acceptor oxidoreductase family protein [Acidobacteriota bacterium]|jgi:2-oxoisovalerate ferredoxin oxidoreductase beta subunit|nr:2-oxoacid:acceptor oxidoreductase family protein [Acidobacteriota bacterium]